MPLKRLLSVTICSLAFLTSNQAAAFETKADYAIMVDTQTGAVLYDKQSNVKMAPSSMSKLMTLYMVFERLKAGNLKLTDKLTVSEKAWRMGGSKMFVHVGDQVTIEDLLRGIVVQSGNDACVVIAEGLMGTESAFAQAMTAKAKQIGLRQSNFVNSTGWPDPNHYMSSRDLAILSMRLINDFPDYYHYFAEDEFTYNNITQPNRNLLLGRDLGVDGLKTGHTEAAGFGIAISGKQGNRRLVLVVNGLDSMAQRAREAELLLQYGFRNFDNLLVAKAGQVIEQAETWYGKKETVPLVTAQDVTISYPVQFQDATTAEVRYQSPIPAPIEAGTHLADLVIRVPDVGEQVVPLVAGEQVERLSWFGKLLRTAKYKWF